MDESKLKRLGQCITNKINFISGTVTPAQSNKNNAPHNIQDIEALDIGIRYLYQMYEKHQKELTVSVQPKYMGSRINMYLFNTDHMNKSYCVTRNGYVYKNKQIDQEICQEIDRMHRLLTKFMTERKIRLMILDGEMLPWTALGQGLIDNEFLPVDKGLEKEIELMKTYNFDEQIKKLKELYTNIHDVYTLESPIIAVEKFGQHVVKDYEKQKDLMYFLNTSDTETLYTTYHKQMELYAMDKSRIQYKPFSILKICFEDGSESIPLVDHSYSQSKMYQMLHDSESDDNSDNQLIIRLSSDTLDLSIGKIKEYFNNLTIEKGYEGVVIKPDYIINGLLPMMKCRNTSYLTIIYGYDYMIEPKLSRLIKNKTTGGKIKQSIKEFELGIQMLKVKYDDISESDEYKQILTKFLYNEDIGLKLDPRL
jgi:hypothetical protein